MSSFFILISSSSYRWKRVTLRVGGGGPCRRFVIVSHKVSFVRSFASWASFRKRERERESVSLCLSLFYIRCVHVPKFVTYWIHPKRRRRTKQQQQQQSSSSSSFSIQGLMTSLDSYKCGGLLPLQTRKRHWEEWKENGWLPWNPIRKKRKREKKKETRRSVSIIWSSSLFSTL